MITIRKVEKMKNKIETVYFQSESSSCVQVSSLEKIGAGYDGIVYKYGDIVLKVIKYDVDYRKQKGMMTFEKALYLKNNLSLKRITQPIDILFDCNGIFSGYVMRYVEDITTSLKKQLGEFTCGEFLESAYLLTEDFNELTRNRVLAHDVNPGSIIYSYNFINLCDMDKYIILENNGKNIWISNRDKLYYALAKVLYFTMKNVDNLDKEQLKEMYHWIKKVSHSEEFIQEFEREIGTDYNQPMLEYAKYKLKQIIR